MSNIIQYIALKLILKSYLFKLNPFHTIPTIVDDGVPVYESHAILVYLVSKYAKDDALYPKDLISQARIQAWFHFDSGVLFPRLRGAMGTVYHLGMKEIPRDRLEVIEQAYELFEEALRGDYLVGDSLTLADISVTTCLMSLNGALPLCESKYPKANAYLERMESVMPYYKELVADPVEETKAFLKQKKEEIN